MTGRAGAVAMELRRPTRALYCQCPDPLPGVGVCRKIFGGYVCV